MSELHFQILDAWPEPYAAAPTLVFRLRCEGTENEPVQSIVLHCQIRIEPQRRTYSSAEEGQLFDLFGDAPHWGSTLKPFLWTNVSTVIPGFVGSTDRELPVPCTYDLDVAAAKYLHGIEDGEIPLLFLFSGSVFRRQPSGLSVTPISWNAEAAYRLPARVWRALMDCYFPQSGWLRLRRETLNALTRVKAEAALATWDDVIESLIRQSGERAA